MRIIFACIALLFIAGNVYSQKTQVEFFSAKGNLYPYLNSYSPTDGFRQFYFEDSQWVRNQSIPDFKDKNKFENLALQYIESDSINPPQLFAYSKKSGNFSFYFLTNDGWTLNSNIPSGKIELNGQDLTAKYTPAEIGKSGFIFSHSSDGSEIEFLEITTDGWIKINTIPGKIPK